MNERRRVDAEFRTKIGVLTMIGMVSTLFWLVGTVALVAWTNWDNLYQQRFFCSDVEWHDLAHSASAGGAQVPAAFHKVKPCESIRIRYRDGDSTVFFLILLGPPVAGWSVALVTRQLIRFNQRNKRAMTLAE